MSMAFYDLKQKIIELSLPDEVMKSLLESLGALESELTSNPIPSMTEVDKILYKNMNSTYSASSAGPSKEMVRYVAEQRLESARRIDWIIAYGKLCKARCDLAEAESEEKRLSDLYHTH